MLPRSFNVDPAALTSELSKRVPPRRPPVTISNDGSDGVDLEVTMFNFTGDFGPEGGGSCAACSLHAADGESCTQHVEFTPTADGATTGTLTVMSDAGQVTNDTVDLSGEGVPSDANLDLDPTAFDFGTLDLNDAAVCQDFVATNTATNDAVTGIATSMVAAPFSMDGNTCNGSSLDPGASCTVTICFDPDAEGTFNGTLDITSDANNVSATFEGEGTATANVSVNPPFGPVNLGTTGAGETLTADGLLSNTGSADADVACQFTSNPGGVFSSDPSPLAATVPAGGEVPFQLSCDIPQNSDDGDVFEATLECSVDGAVAGTHNLSCSTQNFMAIPVNTLQPWALALFALMMLLAGGIGIRFFRAN